MDKKYRVKVICQANGYEGTFEVEAPREGLAKTKAVNEAFKAGFSTKGIMPPPLVTYEVEEIG